MTNAQTQPKGDGNPCFSGKTPLRLFMLIFMLASGQFIFAQNFELWGTTFGGGKSSIGTLYKYNRKTSTHTVEHEFGALSGKNPNKSEMVNYNGKFYGTTSGGGSREKGVIYEWDPQTNIYISKIDFDGMNGSIPNAGLTLKDGKFYGTTSGGGPYDAGVIFEWDPVTNVFKTRYTFSSGSGGAFPSGTMVLKDGKFYGTTVFGGSGNSGTIFEWDPENDFFFVKQSFNGTNGSSPLSPMCFKDGKFYGVTTYGGSRQSGVLFEWEPEDNILVTKVNFAAGANRGISPCSPLLLHDGKLYGTTQMGGSGDGMLYEYDPQENTFTSKYEFSLMSGVRGQGQLLFYDGELYGITLTACGVDELGSLYKFNLGNNEFELLKVFDDESGGAPKSGLTEFEGKLYGVNFQGGHGGSGSIFEWDLAAKEFNSPLHFFDAPNGALPTSGVNYLDGKIYTVTNHGGTRGSGAIVAFDTLKGIAETKVGLDRQKGTDPQCTMVMKDGKYYGFTGNGGTNAMGTIFEWDPVTNVYEYTDFNFGGGSFGSLTPYRDVFYGMTSGGGSAYGGTIFKYNPVTKAITHLADLQSWTGSSPIGALAVKGNKLYGMARYGGSYNGGTIFEFDPETNNVQVKINMNNETGSAPQGELILKDGKFYGTTSYGAGYYGGALFEWDPESNIYTKKVDFGGGIGTYPTGTLTLKNGKFYGTASNGGAYQKGVLYEWNPTTNAVTVLVNFNGENGAYPMYGNLLALDLPSSGNSVALNDIAETEVCPGQELIVPCVSTGEFNENNVFTAYLSDADGDFENEKAIGIFEGTRWVGDTITAFIPKYIPEGGNYRIRVKSSSPEEISEASHFITIKPGVRFSRNEFEPICFNADPISLLQFGDEEGTTFTGDGIYNGYTFNPYEAGVGVHVITAIASNEYGCSDSILKNIEVWPVPVIKIDKIPEVCADASYVNLSAQPEGGVFSGTGVHGTKLEPSEGSPGLRTVTYTITTNEGCVFSGTQDVNIITLQPHIRVDKADFCLGESTALTAPPFYKFLWKRDSNPISNNNPYDSILQVSQSGNYTVTVYDYNGCTGESDPVRINADERPNADLNRDGNLEVCEDDSLQLFVPAGAYKYQWFRGNVAIAGATSSEYYADTTGYYRVGVLSNPGCFTMSNAAKVVDMPYPETPVITFSGNELSTTGGPYYQWFRNGQPIGFGDTSKTLVVTEDGMYFVQVMSYFGCKSSSDTITVTISAIKKSAEEGGLNVFPNPFTNGFNIESSQAGTYVLVDISGKQILTGTLIKGQTPVEQDGLANGVYQLRLRFEDASEQTIKLVK